MPDESSASHLVTPRFQALVDDAKRSLPQHTGDWTDHNVSDPGVTLLEACAQGVDQLAFQVQSLPPTHRQKLLTLMNTAPEGSKTAQASPLTKEFLTKLLQ